MDDYFLKHSGAQIDEGVSRSLPGGWIEEHIKSIATESVDHPGCFYRIVNGVIEWLNPPMQLGVEYRTTERYLGKPVYAMAVSFGAMPNNTTKGVGVTMTDLDTLISRNGTDGFRPIPYINNDLNWSVDVDASKESSTLVWITVGTNFDASARSATFALKYTKTTD